jgi:hypothetical protein
VDSLNLSTVPNSLNFPPELLADDEVLFRDAGQVTAASDPRPGVPDVFKKA